MPSETLTFSNREILKLNEGLAALDGIADRDGSVTRFKFDTKVVWSLAKNRVIVERAAQTYQRARKTLSAQHGVVDGMRLTEKNAPSVAVVLDETEKLLDETQSLEGLLKVPLAELQKHDNALPPGTLAALMPLIEA